MKNENRFAVLIDADNVSAKYIKYILDEVSNHGIITYKRIYGDWTKTTTSSWKEVLLDNSISPMQQYSYTTGKNATDSAMIIDAMDILYSGNVEGFCIVSSDSDFTRLAARLRESGMTVIGMGEEKTPRPFSAACNLFKYIDILVEDENKNTDIEGDIVAEPKDKNESSNSKGKVEKNMTEISIIEDAIIKIIAEYGDEEKGIGIGELGSRLVKRYPDFDVRNYGYTKLSKFITRLNSVDLEVDGNYITVHLKKNEFSIESIENTLINIIKETPNAEIFMGELNKRLIDRCPRFKVRNYGYSKFSRFINDLSKLKVKSCGQNGSVKMVMLTEK